MKRFMFVMMVILMLAGNAYAVTLEWDRNTESDMRDYHVYACYTKGCTVAQSPANHIGTVVQTIVGVKPTYILPPDKEGTAAVSALDTSGNESPLSNTVPFDSLKPKAPASLVAK